MSDLCFEFDAQDLYSLLVHYTDGELPLGGEVKEIGVNPYLGRMVGVLVESNEWTTDTPLSIRYEGKRIASWVEGQEGMKFETRNETPKIQMN